MQRGRLYPVSLDIIGIGLKNYVAQFQTKLMFMIILNLHGAGKDSISPTGQSNYFPCLIRWRQGV